MVVVVLPLWRKLNRSLVVVVAPPLEAAVVVDDPDPPSSADRPCVVVVDSSAAGVVDAACAHGAVVDAACAHGATPPRSIRTRPATKSQRLTRNGTALISQLDCIRPG